MNIQVIDVAVITQAVEDLLKADLALADVAIERAAEIPAEPGRHGFVGIYRETINYPSRAVGAGAGFRRQRVNLILVVKQSDATSGKQCEDRLESLIKRVMDRLLTDHSFGGTVDTLDEQIDVRYEKYDKLGNIFTQQAAIYLSGLINVSASA